MSAPHDRPTVAELLGAVRDFLDAEAAPALEGGLRFHARVAANAIAIAERELRLGPEHAEAHRERLARLGFDDDDALAAAIRSGSLDGRYAEIAEALRDMVRDKLAVANPPYAETRNEAG